MKDKNNTNNNNNNYINKISSNCIKKCITRNISNKRDITVSKKKYFSISSQEDLIKNKFKTIFIDKKISNKKNTMVKKGQKQPTSHHITSPKCPFHKSSKFTKNYNIQSDNIIKYKKSKKLDFFQKKNKLKQTIIIDNEGNNNLNINKRFFTQKASQKIFLINGNAKKNNNKNHIKPISTIKKCNIGNNMKKYIVQNLYNFFKNDNIDNGKTSLLSESNSLFINSKNLCEQKKLKENNNNNVLNIDMDSKILNFEKEDRRNENKKVNECSSVIDLLKLNYGINSMVNNDNNNIICDICDYNSFFKNIPEVKYKNINSLIYSKENYNNNCNDFKSFIESSMQDDFYQSFLYKKSCIGIENKQNDESFNLSQSISEFDNIKKENNKYEFEKIIHLPMKKH